MKSKVAISLLLATILFLSACSVGYEFVIVNASNSPIEVQYTIKPSGMPPNSRTHMPAIVNAVEMKKSEREWKAVPAEQHHIDYKSGKVTVTLAPNQALRVADIINYPGHDSESSDVRFHITSLSLEGTRGSVKYEGRQALTQFRESDDFVITYK